MQASVEIIASGLQSRRWSVNRDRRAAARHLMMLTDGSGRAEAGGEVHELAAPALFWLGDARPGRFHAAAGTTGYRATLGDVMVAGAVGDQAESVSLRYLVDRNFGLSLADAGEARTDALTAMEGMLRETRELRRGSPTLVSAFLRILMVAMLRVAGAERMTLRSGGEDGRLLQRFRQLVESHFREHWRIADYARALGVTTDRLHAVSTRRLARTPKALVTERLAYEAALRLERSVLPIEQISHSLGFGDPAHFSHFFTRATGVRPGAYRRMKAGSPLADASDADVNFSNWP